VPCNCHVIANFQTRAGLEGQVEQLQNYKTSSRDGLVCKVGSSSPRRMTMTNRCRNLTTDDPVVIKSVQSHFRVENERDVLRRFQGRTPYLRPMVDEIKEPLEPTTIVLKYLDDDLRHASDTKKLNRKELKYVSKRILEALSTLHEDGFVHTGKRLSYDQFNL
jgi:hypothetical protein